ncbi:MAG: hypothetical protein WBD28_07330 [Candidatus Zixiibacteriota bacterium]
MTLSKNLMDLITFFKHLLPKKSKAENPLQKDNSSSHPRGINNANLILGNFASDKSQLKDFPISPVSKRSYSLFEDELILPASIHHSSFRIKLYRFLRNHMPVLNSAIWTWTRLCSSPSYFQLKGSENPRLLDSAKEILLDLDRRIFQHSFLRFGGVDALLTQFFGSFFTDGAVCGEVVLSRSKDKVEKFFFIDPATIRFKLKDNSLWELYQETEDGEIRLNPGSTFYCGLDTDPDDPRGKSIFSSIPFVARIEQRLLEDMQKTMHNAGYHRLHIKVKPPERLSHESDQAYIKRANTYFEETTHMMKEIAPEENPITWNDVQIDYVGPSGQYSSATTWYLNHKSVLEDICAGVHLDPFMLGYSYGPPYNWAQIKYELIQRNVISIQSSAKRFMEWIRNIELALRGIPLESEHHFDNRKTFGLLEKRKTEQIHIDNVIRKMEAGFVDQDQAQREIEEGK